jgi:hypothetical protein
MDPTTIVLDLATIERLYVGDANADLLRDLPEFVRVALIPQIETLVRVDRELVNISMVSENEVYTEWLGRRQTESVSRPLFDL